MASSEHTASPSLRETLSLHALAAEWRALLWVYAIAIVVYGGVALAWASDIEIDYLLSDTTAAARHIFLEAAPVAGPELTNDDLFLTFPFYLGIASNIGVLAMFAGAVAALLGAHWVRTTDKTSHDRKRALFWFGLIATTFAVDDLLMLHDGFVPEVLGINGDFAYALYGPALLLFAQRWRASIVQLHPWLLVHGVCFFAVSVAFDLVHVPVPRPGFFEEGAKFVGILSWAGFALCSADTVVRGDK